MNNNLVKIIFSLFLSFNALSAEKVENTVSKIQGSAELPIELNLLLDNLSKTSDYKLLLPIVMNIDTYARALTKEDLFLIAKIEIYKTILRNSEKTNKIKVDGDSLKTLREAIDKSNEPFITWFLQALLRDCESIMANPKYKEYLLQKNNGRIEGAEFKKIEKKIQLLFHWISKINSESIDFQERLMNDLKPVLIQSLLNIEESFFLMALNSSETAIPPQINSPENLKFFSLKKVIAPVIKAPTEKKVEDIIDSITDGPKAKTPSLPKPSSENWLNEDNAPLNLKNMPKPTDDADWLQDF